RLFEGIAIDHDVAILCDDAQWIDSDSAAAVLTLAERISTGSIWTVLTERDVSPIDKRLWPVSSEVMLSELDVESSLRLVAAELPDLQPQVAEVVVQHAGGNPFELVALCEELRESGSEGIER